MTVGNFTGGELGSIGAELIGTITSGLSLDTAVVRSGKYSFKNNGLTAIAENNNTHNVLPLANIGYFGARNGSCWVNITDISTPTTAFTLWPYTHASQYVNLSSIGIHFATNGGIYARWRQFDSDDGQNPVQSFNGTYNIRPLIQANTWFRWSTGYSGHNGGAPTENRNVAYVNGIEVFNAVFDYNQSTAACVCLCHQATAHGRVWYCDDYYFPWTFNTENITLSNWKDIVRDSNARVIARQFKTGTPFYNGWSKTAGSQINGIWRDTPFDGANDAWSNGANMGQTALVQSFSDPVPDNIQERSEDFNYWQVNNAQVFRTAGSAANPVNGQVNAYKMDVGGWYQGMFFYQTETLVVGKLYTVSVHVKYISGTNPNFALSMHGNHFDLTVGQDGDRHVDWNPQTGAYIGRSTFNIEAGNYGAIDLGNGWWRLWYEFTERLGSYQPMGLFHSSAGGAGSIYVFGAQINEGSLGPYIGPTGGGAGYGNTGGKKHGFGPQKITAGATIHAARAHVIARTDNNSLDNNTLNIIQRYAGADALNPLSDDTGWPSISNGGGLLTTTASHRWFGSVFPVEGAIENPTLANLNAVEIGISNPGTVGTGTRIVADAWLMAAYNAVEVDNLTSNSLTTSSPTFIGTYTNILTQSETFDSWTADGSNVTANSLTSPLGSASATPAIVKQNSAYIQGTTTTGSVSFVGGGSATAGNILIFAIGMDKTSGAFTPPSGFTLVQGSDNPHNSIYTYIKKAVGGENSFSYTQATTSISGNTLAIFEISGLDATDYLGVSLITTPVENVLTLPIGPTTAPAYNNGFALVILSNDSQADVTGAPTFSNGFNVVLDARSHTNTGAAPLIVATKQLTTADPVSTTATWTGLANQASGIIVVLKPGATGGTTADTINYPAQFNGRYNFVSGNITAGVAHTYSVFMKWLSGTTDISLDVNVAAFGGTGNTRAARFNPSTGAIINIHEDVATDFSRFGVVAYPNGWYRFWVTFLPSATTTNLAVGLYNYGAGASSIYAWGAMINAGPLAAYIGPTTTGTLSGNASPQLAPYSNLIYTLTANSLTTTTRVFTNPTLALFDQYLVAPSSDINAGAWKTNTGAVTNLFTAVDETTAVDTDYITSAPVFAVGGSGGSAVLWNPTHLPAGVLQVWLDASDNQSIAVDGSVRVTNWDDKSGNNRRATAVGGTNGPAYTANNVTATGNQVLVFQDTLLPQTYDVAIVGTPNTTASGYRTLIQHSSGNHSILLDVGSTALGVYDNGTFRNSGLTWPATLGQAYVSVKSGIDISMGRDGSALSAFTTNLSINTNLYTSLLNNYGGNQGFGTINELVFTTPGISPDLRQRLEGYLAHKWDLINGNNTLKNLLPSNHPYKSAAPTTGGTTIAGLISRYSFASDANDGVGSNNGTLVGAPTISGGVLTLNGTSQRVSFASNFGRQNLARTYSIWFQTTDTGGGNIVGQRSNDSLAYVPNINILANGTVTGSWWQAGDWSVASGTGYNNGNWHHVAWILNGGSGSNTGTLILNGINIGTTGTFSIDEPWWQATDIGYNPGGPEGGTRPFRPENQWFAGSLDDFRVYDNALTPTQAAAIYNAGRDPNIGGPATYSGNYPVSIGLAPSSPSNLNHGKIVRSRIRAPEGGMNARVRLYQGATLIAEFLYTNVPTVWTNYASDLTAAQIATITNYADLRIEITAEAV